MRVSAWLAGAFVLTFAGCPVGGEQDKQAKQPADLAWVPAEGAALLSVRPADLWKSDLGKAFLSKLAKEEKTLAAGIGQEVGLAPVEMERLTVVFPDLKAPSLIFVRSAGALEKEKLFKGLVPGGAEKKSGQRSYFASASKAAAVLGDREYVVGSPAGIESLLENGPTRSRDGLAVAAALAAKGHALVAGANPSAVGKPDDDLHAELEPYRPLLKARHATVGVDVGAKWAAKLHIVFGSEDDAKQGHKAIEKAREEGRSLLGSLEKKLKADKSDTGKALAEVVSLADGALKGAALQCDGKEVTADLTAKVEAEKLAVVGVYAVRSMREAAARSQSANNLKQIGLAMHGYLDAENTFPPRAVFDKDGKALLSWRVLLLPYLGQKDLYDQFKLDEPWDSKHNKTLLAKIPPVYRAPAGKHKKDDTTFYLGFSGKGAFFEGKKGIAITDVTDDVSNTIMVVEGGKEVPWTKPEDLDFDADKELPKLGGLFEGGFMAAFCDGSVRFLLAKDKNLKAYVTRNGGEAIKQDQ
jgi:hypothetical protein